MVNPSKNKGTSWEKALQDYLRHELKYDVDRLHLTGAEDEGDLVVREEGSLCIIEAKDVARRDLEGWMGEAFKERTNYAAHRGLSATNMLPLVVMKRRNKSVKEAFVMTTLEEFFR